MLCRLVYGFHCAASDIEFIHAWRSTTFITLDIVPVTTYILISMQVTNFRRP